ncbi:hypothetical protein EJB05_33686, partial [Eragrostis curvula]
MAAVGRSCRWRPHLAGGGGGHPTIGGELDGWRTSATTWRSHASDYRLWQGKDFFICKDHRKMVQRKRRVERGERKHRKRFAVRRFASAQPCCRSSGLNEKGCSSRNNNFFEETWLCFKADLYRLTLVIDM